MYVQENPPAGAILVADIRFMIMYWFMTKMETVCIPLDQKVSAMITMISSHAPMEYIAMSHNGIIFNLSLILNAKEYRYSLTIRHVV